MNLMKFYIQLLKKKKIQTIRINYRLIYPNLFYSKYNISICNTLINPCIIVWIINVMKVLHFYLIFIQKIFFIFYILIDLLINILIFNNNKNKDNIKIVNSYFYIGNLEI